MSISYLIYQAERPQSAVERREADLRAGQLAASIARAGRAVKAAVTRCLGVNRFREPVIPGDDLIPAANCRR